MTNEQIQRLLESQQFEKLSRLNAKADERAQGFAKLQALNAKASETAASTQAPPVKKEAAK